LGVGLLVGCLVLVGWGVLALAVDFACGW
jgi:hypothetical protein